MAIRCSTIRQVPDFRAWMKIQNSLIRVDLLEIVLEISLHIAYHVCYKPFGFDIFCDRSQRSKGANNKAVRKVIKLHRQSRIIKNYKYLARRKRRA